MSDGAETDTMSLKSGDGAVEAHGLGVPIRLKLAGTLFTKGFLAPCGVLR